MLCTTIIVTHSLDALSVMVDSTFVTSTSLTISWTLTDDVTVAGYSISYSNIDCPGDIYDDITGISDSETMYTLTNVEEGTEYSVTVTVILSDDRGTALYTVTASTLSIG